MLTSACLLSALIDAPLLSRVELYPGVEYERTANVKDQIELSGNDIQAVSEICSRIHQTCTVKRKDIRKFLDGIYISERGNVIED